MNFGEDLKGSLEVGKVADMVVLGEGFLTIDPDHIKGTPIEMTIIGGASLFGSRGGHAVVARKRIRLFMERLL